MPVHVCSKIQSGLAAPALSEMHVQSAPCGTWLEMLAVCCVHVPLCAAFKHSFGTCTSMPQSVNVLVANAVPPPVDDLAALWAQLQLKHTQEAAAASMSRKASAEHQVPKPALAQQVAGNVQKQPDTAANVSKNEARPGTGSKPNDKATSPAVSSSNVPQQQSSEESFWKMMQQ